MPRIRILPETLSNQIAAGEVVERPASVVKELVENSLDAGSTRIVIEIEKGGRSLIQVSDNGCGMSRDDALLSIERYATSKLYADSDLFAIRTLGFRGEALPSIASVSRLHLTTREASADAGVELVLEGGKLLKVMESGAPEGTRIAVRHLFFNTPVRLKFLKTIATELGHISDVVSSLALGWPQVHFRLIHNGSLLQNWSAAPDAATRIADVLGQASRTGLFPVHREKDGIFLSGWTSPPHISRKSPLGIYVFVNGRFVRGRMMHHALLEAYGGRLMKGQFPLAVLNITLPCDEVDVNVHPAKQEVRFFRQQQVYDAIVAAVADGLAGAEKPAWATSAPETPAETISGANSATHGADAITPGFPETIPQELIQAEKRYPYVIPAEDRNRPPGSRVSAPPVSFTGTGSSQTTLWKASSLKLKPVAQFLRSYIICESGENLVLLDQHAAHERVLYERLTEHSEARQVPVQRLLIPETLDLGYRQAGILERLLPELCRNGVDIEIFGKQSFVITSVPAFLAGKDVRPLVVEIVDYVAETGLNADMKHAMDECLKIMACHGAIRANQTLSLSEMVSLISELVGCRVPAHCPHGRPTWIEWSRQLIEKLFKRIQ